MPISIAATELSPDYIHLVINLGWLAVLTIVGVSLIAGVVGAIAFNRTERGGAKTFSLLFERAQALKMSAIVLIVLSTLVLGVLHIIDSNGIVGILSGIAGYVLGGLDRINRPVNTIELQPTPPIAMTSKCAHRASAVASCSPR